MNKTRLEAFSDGVLAIIITIMVLELKVPHTADWQALSDLKSVFFCYFLSFVNIGIYWGNHHHLLHTVKRVNSGIIWANMNQLFWLSLIPFGTNWMGENEFSANTVVVYAVLLLLCGTSFTILRFAIRKTTENDTALSIALQQMNRKEVFSIIAYSISIFTAFINPMISCAIFLIVSAVWIIPDKNIEKALSE